MFINPPGMPVYWLRVLRIHRVTAWVTASGRPSFHSPKSGEWKNKIMLINGEKKERSGWRESTSRWALFSLPLISGYPRSGFPRGAFALVPRRFADSWSKGIVPDFRQNWNYFLVCFSETLSQEIFLCIQDRNEDFLAIKLYFQHYSLNFNNFHRKIRNVFLFFLYKRSQEIVFVQYTRIEKNLRDYKNVFFNSTGKFKFIERNKFMTI